MTHDSTRYRVFAYAKKRVGAVMMRPILTQLVADPRFDVFGAASLFGDSSAGASLFAEVGLPTVRPIPKWLARLRRFDLYLSADFGVVAPRARLKVHVFHGVSFRNHAIHHNALRYDLLLLAGNYMRRQFEANGILTAATADRFVDVGVPKLDPLFDGSLERGAILRRLRLDPTRRTVLYAPTWSKKVSSLEHHGRAVLDRLANYDANVIVKLHDNSLDPRKGGDDWGKVLATIDRDGFHWSRDADVVPLMVAADQLVSDASSVANEFALLDKPIVFLDVPDLRGRLKPKADLETWGRKGGMVAASLDELTRCLDHGFVDPDEMSERRQALANDLFFGRGGATDRAVAAIRARLGMEASVPA